MLTKALIDQTLTYLFSYLLCFLKCHLSLLQSSGSLDPSEIILICWYAAQETFLIIISVKNSCCFIFFFVEKGGN